LCSAVFLTSSLQSAKAARLAAQSDQGGPYEGMTVSPVTVLSALPKDA